MGSLNISEVEALLKEAEKDYKESSHEPLLKMYHSGKVDGLKIILRVLKENGSNS
jgi:hypothetical protein